jgi:hypothetical protein
MGVTHDFKHMFNIIVSTIARSIKIITSIPNSKHIHENVIIEKYLKKQKPNMRSHIAISNIIKNVNGNYREIFLFSDKNQFEIAMLPN